MTDPRHVLEDEDISRVVPMESLESLREEALDVAPELADMPGFAAALEFVDQMHRYYDETPED